MPRSLKQAISIELAIALTLLLGFLTPPSVATDASVDQQMMRTFRAGPALVPLTPRLGMRIVGDWDSPLSTKIHDDLHVRCLVLDDGSTRLGFAIRDNVGIPREVFDQARRLISAHGSMLPENVMMAATHTHTGVSARGTRISDGEIVLDAYQNQVAKGIADGIRQAVAALQPAKIGWGSFRDASEVHNRRWFVSDEKLRQSPFGVVDRVRMNPPKKHQALLRPVGPIDPEVSFLSVVTHQGRPISVLAN